MIRQMTVNELEKRLGEDNAPPVLLDVREPWEWDACRMPGAITLSLGEIPARAEELPATPRSSCCVITAFAACKR